jgi:hypothetical protein
MSLQIRRGTSTQLANITPVIGELIYTTDTQAVFVGDGTTAGGVPIAVGGAGNVSGTNLLTTGIASAGGNVIGGNITTTGQISATGNITGDYLFGNGSALTGIAASSVQANALTGYILSSNVVTSSLTSFGTLTSLSVSGNVAAGNVSGTLTTASQNNITSVGTLSSLSVTANILGGNLNTGGQVSATGNVRGNYLRATLDINAGGNIAGVNFTGTGVSVTGNITGAYIIGNGSQMTGLPAGYTNSNVSTFLSAFGSNTISTTGSITSGNVTGGNILTDGIVSATGNITGGNVVLSAASSLRIGNLIITDATIDSTEHQITIGSTGNVGNIIIAGNLQVLGNTTTINSNVLVTNDLTVNYANNAINSAAANGGGIEVGPVGSPFITWLYNNTANTWNTAGGISAIGNVTGGGLVGTVYTNGIVNTGSNATGNIGSASTYFDTVFATATTALYADLAEIYSADAAYAPGTVVVFGGEKEITVSTTPSDERVAGAISTQPAHLMNAGQPGLPVALRGRVPVKVIGPVVKGDSLVTSATPGVAQSVGHDRSYGQAVFAKSLETNSEDGEKVIIAVIL